MKPLPRESPALGQERRGQEKRSAKALQGNYSPGGRR